jgi:aspartyl-tRNA(Asn)/glutamyl-tRNA(Gln) amidotransferase subunit A
MSQDVSWLDAAELVSQFATGQLSPVEVVEALLVRAEQVQHLSGAFVTLTPELALAGARRAEQEYRRAGRPAAPLLGVPVTLKDLTPTRGVRTTLGSLRWRDWVPEADAPVAERLARAGAILLGKTNTAELGWKADTGGPLLPTTRNPHDLTRTAGGSSGGAAAAVAAGVGPLAQGGDAAGSIRVPAAFCGVIGFKPSTGAIPIVPANRFGDLGAIGPLARSVRDVVLFMAATSGPDERDPLSLAARHRRCARRAAPPTGLRTGWLPRLDGAEPAAPVAAAVGQLVTTLTELGHPVEEIDPPGEDLAEVIDTIWCEAFAPLAGDGGVDPGLAEVARRGRAMVPGTLTRARQWRQQFHRQMAELMARYDLLLTPTCPGLASPLAAAPTAAGAQTRPAAYLASARMAYPFNLTGQPAVSLPVWPEPGGLPAGAQLIGRCGEDGVVLGVAAQLEAAGVVRVRRPGEMEIA